jgi:hypothetical protein
VAFSQQYWQTWIVGATWVDVRVGDFDGSGHDGLIARVAQNGAVFISLGFNDQRNYGAQPDPQRGQQVWAAGPGFTWVDTTVVDLDGDGHADVISRLLQTGQWIICFWNQTANQLDGQAVAGIWSPSATFFGASLLNGI